MKTNKTNLTIREYIAQTGRSISSVARSMGVSRQTLYNWMDDGAVVDKTDNLGNIALLTLSKVLYETQVAK